MNRGGAMFVSPEPLKTGSLVFFYAETYRLLGWATVRWCAPAGPFTYQVGIEFRSALMRAEFGEWQFSRAAASALEV